MLKHCSPPLMLLLTRKEAKYAISYASMMGLSQIPSDSAVIVVLVERECIVYGRRAC